MKPSFDWEEDDLLQLVKGKAQESLSLEFKACNALGNSANTKKEISKDVSAFANAAGGTIVYGIIEDKDTREASQLDKGYDPNELGTEWLEQVIDSNIQRRIEGLRVKAIPLSKTQPGRVLYLVHIPESSRAPHMAADHRFYKRLGTTTTHMEEYEVREKFRRETYPSREIACAWRDSVINPMIAHLEREEEVLQREVRTWDRLSLTYKQLGQLSGTVSSSANREDFLLKHETVVSGISYHDQSLSSLVEQTRQFFHEFIQSEWFVARYEEATKPDALNDLKAELPRLTDANSNADVLRELFSASTRDDHLSILGELTINNIGMLSPLDRTSAPLWNKHRERFIELLTLHSPLAPSWQPVVDAQTQFANDIGKLKTTLKAIRSELSVRHGIPVEGPTQSFTIPYSSFDL